MKRIYSHDFLKHMPNRWNTYHLVRGDEVSRFWVEHLAGSQRNILMILSRGFDPRISIGPKTILTAGGHGKRDARILTFNDNDSLITDHIPIDDTNQQFQEIERLFEDVGEISSIEINMYAPDRRRVGSQQASDIFTDISQLDSYTDIVVDVSGMPRSIFFPLIGKILYVLESEHKSSRNLFVLVAEDPKLDAAINPNGLEELADFMAMFRGNFARELQATLPTVWFPVLGEGRLKHLTRIKELLSPDEVCPLIPSPARDPRRADNLVREYRNFFFDELELDPRDFIYASESNPFDVYRRLRSAVEHYSDTLKTIGGCRIAFSALSSKLMSLGVLLAAYETKIENLCPVGVAHVDSHGYRMSEAIPESELFGLWIAGECYE
jgi:hypothetical protein